MNARSPWVAGLVVSAAMFAAAPALAWSAADGGRAPYLERDGRPADPARTPLVATNADVDVTGDVARVTLTQLYENRDPDPIEVVYVFPGSTRAAVTALTMTIGDRVITARVHERAEAREVYEDAKAAGKTATLLEMTRPNELRMSVANILPGDAIQIEVEYIEQLRSDDGVYELVLPGPVGRRYEAPDPAVDTEARPEPPPYWPTAALWGPMRGVSVDLHAAVPLSDVASPSHAVPALADSRFYHYAHTELGGAPRDFILRYRLGADTVATGVLRYDAPDGERYFMATVQPPLRVAPGAIAPREYVFILDTSGSMSGWPLETAKGLMSELLAGLRPSDTFNVVAFAGGADVLSPRSLAATPANTRQLAARIDALEGSGATDLLAALRTAFALRPTPGFARTFVIVTDGFVSVSPEAYRLIRERLDDANVFVFGIGGRPNRDLIEHVAAAGRGEPLVVTEESEAYDAAQRFRRYIEAPVLTDVRITVDADAYDVTPTVVPDLFAQRPLVVTGKLRGDARGAVIVTARAAFGPFSAVVDLGAVAPNPDNAAIAAFWARDRVAELGEREAMGEEVRGEIVAIGLAHHLLTRYTSFVAVDELVRGDGSAPRTVAQPLPDDDVENDAPANIGGALRVMKVDASAQNGLTNKMAMAMRSAESGDGIKFGAEVGGLGFGGSGTGGGGDGAGLVSRHAAGRGGASGVGEISGLGGVGARETGGPGGPERRSHARIKLALKSVHGKLTTAQVLGVVKRRQGAFRYCYERELNKDPKLAGGFLLLLTIGADGRVTIARGKPGMNAAVTRCVEQHTRRLRFPEPEDARPVQVELELIFLTEQ